MVSAVSSVKNWFHDIPPDGATVKVIALIPIVSNIFLALKERQYMKGYRENYVDPAALAKAHWNSPLIKKSQKCEEQINALSKLSTTVFNWGQAQRVALIAGIIFCPVEPLAYGLLGIFLVGQLHHIWSWHKAQTTVYDYNIKGLELITKSLKTA